MKAMYSTQHLTSEQIDALLFADTGKRDDAATLHLETCAWCSAELTELRLSIGAFREATTEYAERKRPRTQLLSGRLAPGLGGIRGIPAYFALAASVAVAAVIVPLVRPLPKAPTSVQAVPHAGPVETDDALLMEIDQQLDASVPAVMEPLVDPTGHHRKHELPKTTDIKED